MRTLVVTHYIPKFPAGGSSMRDYCLAREMANRHEVTFLLPDYGEASRAEAEPLKSFCRVQFFDLNGGQPWPLSRRLLYSLNRRLPIENVWRLTRNEPAIVQALEPLFSPLLFTLKQIDWTQFDLLQVEHSQLGSGVVDLPIPVPAVLDWHNVYSVVAARQFARAANPRKKLNLWYERRRVRQSEEQVAKRFDRSVAVSEPDAAGIRELHFGAKVDVVPNGVNCEYFSNPEPAVYEEKSLVFTGRMDYAPNEEGVLFFCDKVLPYVLRTEPEVRLYVVGQQPSPSVRELEGRFPGTVHVTGYVEDVRPYLQRAAVSVVPLLDGGGTRLKILEAMAMRIPVVSTTIGAEGLGLENGNEIVIADEPEELALAVLSQLADPERRQQLSERGHQAAKRQFEWHKVASQLNDVWERATYFHG